MNGSGGGGVTTVNPAATTTAASTSSCNDLGTDCPSRAYLCTNQLYYTLMTQQCPKTCNRCSGGGVGSRHIILAWKMLFIYSTILYLQRVPVMERMAHAQERC